MLRGVADSFFDELERIKEDSIVVDFEGVRSISRSFAHQYVLRKRTSTKKIVEANVPENVSKMLRIIEISSATSKPKHIMIDPDHVKVITI